MILTEKEIISLGKTHQKKKLKKFSFLIILFSILMGLSLVAVIFSISNYEIDLSTYEDAYYSSFYSTLFLTLSISMLLIFMIPVIIFSSFHKSERKADYNKIEKYGINIKRAQILNNPSRDPNIKYIYKDMNIITKNKVVILEKVSNVTTEYYEPDEV